MKHFTEADLAGLLEPGEVVDAMRAAFLELARARVAMQPRVPTDLDGVRLNTMGAMIPALGFAGAKVYTATGSSFSFIVLLFSMKDGRLVATFDAGTLTGLRTAGVSALVAGHLARPDARCLSIFGTGVQAAAHASALARALPIESIRVVGRARANEFAEHVRATTGLYTRTCTADEALADADVVVTATRSTTPLFDGARLPAGCTVLAVGSARPAAAEIDRVTIERCARIVVESRESARHEAGDLLIAHAAGTDPWSKTIEVAELVSGAAPGRASSDEINLYESLGSPLEDVAVAALAYQRLRARGLA